MAWTTRRFVSPLLIAALAMSVSVVGCGPSEKDLKIEDLTAENDQLKSELDDRDRLINEALVRENEARGSIDELNQRIAQMRADSQKPQAQQGADGWITTPTFDMISIPGEVMFASGKADLSAQGRSTLARLASDIRARYGDRDLYVFGHTDNEPIRKSKWKDNWELGSARALSAVRELAKLGVPRESLIQANCGEYRPKASNSNKGTRVQNRRVEFYAVKRTSGVIDATAARGFGED
jgi:flagellar motor protein MotB